MNQNATQGATPDDRAPMVTLAPPTAGNPPPLPAALAFVDTETGGLRHSDRPWEVGILTLDPDGTETWHLFHVTDFHPADTDPKALQMSGFYHRHPLHATDHGEAFLAATGPSPDEPIHHHVLPEAQVAWHVERLTRDRVVVGCNPSFDREVLIPMLTRNGLAPTWAYRPICATTYAAGALGLPPYLWSNGAVGEALGVPRDVGGTAHTALADVEYARKLLFAAHAHASSR